MPKAPVWIAFAAALGLTACAAKGAEKVSSLSNAKPARLGVTQTLPLYVEDRFVALDLTGAFAAGLFLGLVAVAVLLLMTRLGRRLDRSDVRKETR